MRKIKLLSDLNNAILSDYLSAANDKKKMPHEYAIVTSDCHDGNIIFGFTKLIKWKYEFISLNKWVIINFDSERNFKENLEKFLGERFTNFTVEYV